MRYNALACDFDGTLADGGHVGTAARDALARLRASGRRLVLVTGRTLDDLTHTFRQLDLFDRIVAENGAVLYCPATGEQTLLGPPPPAELVQALLARGVRPLSAGQVIVATWHPHESSVLEAIGDLGLDQQIAFNKGAVMVLPAGVTKATGLNAALAELRLSAHNVAGIGDAENDIAFLQRCGCAAAVANALPSVASRSDIITRGSRGDGVVELARALLKDDLATLEPHPGRHDIALGIGDDGQAVYLGVRDGVILVTGKSGSGKSTLAVALVEALIARDYQVCIIDPEGDYSSDPAIVRLGGSDHVASAAEVLSILEHPSQQVAVNLLGVPLDARAAYAESLLHALRQLRAETGRPHWLIIDEAHHVLPAWQPDVQITPHADDTVTVLVTVNPENLHPAALAQVDRLIVTGAGAEQEIRAFCWATGESAPDTGEVFLLPGEALVWNRRTQGTPIRVSLELVGSHHRRHRRKYAEGDVGAEHSFYFRGPDGRHNIPAHNLTRFLQIARTVDDATWQFHLQRGDYSRWVRDTIADRECADEIARIEATAGLSCAESRERIRDAIEERYTLPA